MAVPYHTHTFDIPVASTAEAEAGLINNKVITPAQLQIKLSKSANLSDLEDAGEARTNLGLEETAPGAAGLTILGSALNSDVRNFLDTAPYVATRTALKALDTTKDTVSILKEAGREGVFNWKAGDFSAQIAADTAEGVYLKADAIASTVGAWVRVFNGVADVRWFGAVGDGTTNDKPAIDVAVVLGFPLIGAGLTYGVSGNVDLGAVFHLENIKFKQLDPGVNNRRTLASSNCLYGRLTNVTVDRNGDGTYTGGAVPAIDDADIGIRISCDTDGRVYIDGCTVTGDGFGGGIAVYSASGGYIRNCRVYNMKAGSPTYTALTDDAIEGIKTGSCQNFSVTGNLVNNLSTEYTGHAEWNRFSRGVAISGGSGVDVLFNTIYDVDQAVDISGNLFPKRINVYGNKISSALTWGVKCANSAREIVVQGNNITKIGISAVVISAPTSSIASSGISLANCSGAVTISDNVIREVGDNNPGVLATVISGVAVLTNHADYAGYPRDIRIFNNDIEGNGNMLYGIYSDVVYSSGPGIVEANNRIETFGTARVLAVQYDSVTVYNSANFSVPNNAVTAVAFTAEDDDNSAMIAVTSSTVTIRRTGWYNVEAQVFWTGNTTGSRQLYFYKNGSPIAKARSVVSAPSANDFTQAMQQTRLFLVAGDTLSLRAFQNSGGALDIRYEYTWFTVVRS